MDPYIGRLAQIWWNELSEAERRFVLERATAIAGHDASAYDAFSFWRVGKIPLKPPVRKEPPPREPLQ